MDNPKVPSTGHVPSGQPGMVIDLYSHVPPACVKVALYERSSALRTLSTYVPAVLVITQNETVIGAAYGPPHCKRETRLPSMLCIRKEKPPEGIAAKAVPHVMSRHFGMLNAPRLVPKSNAGLPVPHVNMKLSATYLLAAAATLPDVNSCCTSKPPLSCKPL